MVEDDLLEDTLVLVHDHTDRGNFLRDIVAFNLRSRLAAGFHDIAVRQLDLHAEEAVAVNFSGDLVDAQTVDIDEVGLRSINSRDDLLDRVLRDNESASLGTLVALERLDFYDGFSLLVLKPPNLLQHLHHLIVVFLLQNRNLISFDLHCLVFVMAYLVQCVLALPNDDVHVFVQLGFVLQHPLFICLHKDSNGFLMLFLLLLPLICHSLLRFLHDEISRGN